MMKKQTHFRGLSPISRRLASAHVPSSRPMKGGAVHKVPMGLPMTHQIHRLHEGMGPSEETITNKLATHANAAGRANQRIDYEQQKMQVLEQRLKDLGIDLDDEGGMEP